MTSVRIRPPCRRARTAARHRRQLRHRRGHRAALAASGADVALVARRRDRLGRCSASASSERRRTALVLEADVTDQAQAAGRRAAQTVARARPARHPGQQRRRDAARPGRARPGRGVAADGRSSTCSACMYCAHAALPHLLAAARGRPAQVADWSTSARSPGRVARAGSGVYNATKYGVGAFSESLRQEVTQRHVRVSLVEPGAVATELAGHNRPEVLEGLASASPTWSACRRRTSPTPSATSSPGRGTSRSTSCSSARPSRRADPPRARPSRCPQHPGAVDAATPSATADPRSTGHRDDPPHWTACRAPPPPTASRASSCSPSCARATGRCSPRRRATAARSCRRSPPASTPRAAWSCRPTRSGRRCATPGATRA